MVARKPPKISVAMRAARTAARMTQTELAGAVGVSRRQIERWENERSAVLPKWAAGLLRALQAAPEADIATLRTALGVAQKPAREATERAVRDAVYAAADQLDVGPKRLRAALATLFTACDGLGLSAKEVAAMLAALPPKATS
jgi:transcriptional regulator with XRE-family HTH domain